MIMLGISRLLPGYSNEHISTPAACNAASWASSSGAGVNQNEAEFAVEGGGVRRPMRLRRLPVDGNDVVHRVHQGLPLALADKRGVRKTVGGVFGPRRSDGPVFAAQVSQHVHHPAG